jgi:hypothetical protein
MFDPNGLVHLQQLPAVPVTAQRGFVLYAPCCDRMEATLGSRSAYERREVPA